METSSDANSLLDPNFALNLYRKFGKIREISSKIKSIIEEFRKRSAATSQSTSKSTVKSNLKSNELRDEAERFLRNTNKTTLFRALELYNESLCYAEPDNGEHVALLYASRANIYFDLKEYQICLENITLAEDKGCPENRLKKLKTDSLELLQRLSNNRKRTEEDVKIQLTVKPHPQIPFAANCLELTTDSIRGRYLTTNEDIDPGSIVVTEYPFEKVLSSDCLYQRCTICLKRNSLNLIPCPNCTKAMFCSELCMKEATDSFHRFECPIIDCLIDVGGQITVRTFLKAIQSFTSIQGLTEFVQSTDTHNLTAFSFNHSETLSAQQNYQQIHGLSTNKDIRTELDLFTHVMVAALFYYELSCHSPFKDLLAGECRDDDLMELMFRIELIATINSFNFNDLSSLQEEQIIGTGLYPLSSLINHSCSPNACPKYYKNKLILYTTQPIKKGESISISYNGTHAFLTKEKRQSFLNGKYHFFCQCTACVNNFPLLHNMALANVPEIHSNGTNVQLDRAIAEDIYRKCCAYLREYHRHYPCREIYSVQMCLSKLLSYLLMNDENMKSHLSDFVLLHGFGD